MIEGRVFQAKGKGMVGPKFWVCLVFGCLFLGIVPITATAAINEQIQFSGELVTTNKTSVSNGNYNFKFELYNDAAGGSTVWSETYDENNGRVSVTDGLFSVSLGSHSSLSGVDFNNSSLYLQVYYDPGNDGIYEESFTTRIRLTAAPYAFNSTKLGGKTESAFGTLSENELVTGSWQFNDQLRFGDDDFSNYVGFQAPSTVTSNLVWTLPAADGSSGQFLRTNGSGTLSWAAASGVAALDDLTDVTLTAVADNELLAYDTATSTWINQTAAQAGLAPAGNYITALTGDVTATGPGSAAATIANGAVSLTKMADMATASFLGRNTAGVGSPEVLSVATAKTLLNLSGTNTGDQTITLTGGVTGSGNGSFAATVITNANLTGPITSTGNATAIASQTGTGTTFVMDNSPTLITPALGAATYTTLVGGNITDSALTAGRVTFAGTVGILQDSANMTFNTTNGLILAAGSTSALQLSSTAGTAVGGILFGADANLYRSGANILKTDDSLVIAGASADLLTQGDLRFYDSDSSNYVGLQAPATVGANIVFNLPTTDGAGGQCLSTDGVLSLVWAACGGGSGAPTVSQYVTLALDGTLTSERVLTGTANQIILTDGGANGNIVLSTPQNIGTASNVQFAGITATGTAALDGGITVDTNNFTVSGTTGAVGIVSAQTTGTTLGISYDSATQTGALTGLAVDFTNITPDATNAVYGIKIDDPASTTASTEYGLYQAGTNWDYGAYFDDLVRIADNGLVLGSTAVTSTAAELNILDGATLSVTELNYLDGTVVTAGGVIFGNGTYLANTGVGNSGELLTSAGAGTPTWTAQSGINAGQLDSLDSTDFLRATASDTYEGSNDRTLTIQSVLTAADRASNLVTISQANDGTFNQTAGALLNVSQADTASSTNVVYIQNAGTGYALAFEQGTTVADGIVWGADANLVTLYRSANDTLKTDDALVVTGHTTFEGVTSTGATGTGKLVYDDTPTLVTPALGAATYTTLVGGNITDSGLTVTRVTFAGTAGILQDSANMTFDTTNGLILAAGSASALKLSDAGGTAVGGILFGTDTNLYRSGANILYTDDSFTVGTNLTVAGTSALQGATTESKVNAASGSADALTLSGTLGIFNGTDTFRGIYLNYTNVNHTGATNVFNGIDFANITGDADAIETAINVGTGWDYGLTLAIGGTAALNLSSTTGTAAGGILLGADVTLYRSAADTLKTDDALTVVGHTTFEGVTSTGATGTGKLVYDGTPTLVTPALGAATYTTLVGGNITDSGLTATRVVFAGTAGILQDSANMTFDTTNGLILAAGSASALQLSSTAGTAAGGILFGTDANIYRSAANQLQTDDDLAIGNSASNAILGITGGAGFSRNINFYSGTNTAANLRWLAQVTSTAESGSNAGSNFQILSRDDAGGAIATNLIITRGTGAWVLAYPTATDVALTAFSATTRQAITATASKNFIGQLFTQQYQIAGGFSNTGTGASFFYQNLRGLVAGLSDTGTLTNQYGITGNVGHTGNDKYTNPLTTNVAGLNPVMNIVRGTITNSYSLFASANNTLVVPSTWVANTAYTVTDRVKPTVANGNYYAASTAGTSDATTEPIWPDTSVAGQAPATIVDGTVTWTEIIIPSITNEYGIYITSATAHNYFGGNVGIGSTTTNSSRLSIAGAHSMIAWGVNGASIRNAAATHTDTSSSGTVATAVDVGLGTPTFAASAATTFTNAATLYIANAPSAGSNVTLTKAWAAWVDAGDVRLDGNLTVGSTPLATPVGTVDIFATTGGIATLGRNDTSVTANDVLGQIDFYSNDTSTTTNFNAARIQVQGTNTVATDINPGAMIFSTTPVGVAAALTEGFRIDNAQKLWIGGGAGLDTNLYRSAADTLYTDDSFTVGANFIAAGTSALQGATTESKVNAASGSADALTLSGTLGIFNGSDTFRGLYLNYTNVDHTGSTNNFYGIDIAGITADAQASEYAINIGAGWDAAINFANTAGNVDFRSAKADTAGTSQFLFNTSATVSSATLFAVQNNGTDKFIISAAGTITDLQTYSDTVGATNRDLFVDNTGKFGYVSSSIRYKENVKALGNNDTNWLYNLHPVTFDYIDKTKGVHQIGLIAEDVAQIYPELVSYNEKDPTLPETVNYSKMVVPLLHAVQGLHTSLEDVNQQVQNLVSGLNNALVTNTITANNINTSSGDLVLSAASGKVRITSSLEVDGQVILHNDLKVDGEIAGASIDLGDQTSGHGTIIKNESEVFINSQVVKSDDKIVLTPTYNSSLLGNNVQLFRGDVTENTGFKVKAVITKPLIENLEFDWLIVK